MSKLITAAFAAAMIAGSAAAAPVTLRPDVSDIDGQVTLGDLFDGAGSAADVVIAKRIAPSVVLEASQVQMLASRAGLQWANEQRLRRVIVRGVVETPQDGAQATVSRVATRQPAAEQVIRSGDVVDLAWSDGQITLTVQTKALGAATEGQWVKLQNPASKKVIEAVAMGPGQAMIGPSARRNASPANRYASR
ncbi:flagella basal body P-ring formation protein FlgA [Caulobacter sp. NIBR2454]|uniref:flagella basal body P-ring formation protein FlgA n=1 Tax=Caulobacter sp. NIBR2454 TaxID=3015996 RepID=UPI0022B65175|nr:flagella basal body P-ring formation protein FlgA [Caulobacter sp. NIBR2454]